ncbi:MAG TPA: glycosyl hydrolase family 28 protein [Polyangia bacterium]|nr:glycosyl hydrolase family 28 protein [Polyangia bacterium]
MRRTIRIAVCRAAFLTSAALAVGCGGGSSAGAPMTGASSGGSGGGGTAATGAAGAPASGGAPGTGGADLATGGTTATGGDSGVAGRIGAGGNGGAGHGGAAGATGGGAGGAVGGASGSDPCASNPAAVPLPSIPAGTFDVKATGATGDGKTDDTRAVQAALTAAKNAGGGTVVVPAGTFLCGPLAIGSGTNLQLAAGAVLKMLPYGTYPSPPPAFITTAGASHDIAITGAGTIDGQGQAWWDAFAADASVARPQEMSLGNTTRVQVSGIRLIDSPEEHIWVKGDTDVTITGITISTLAVAGKSPPKNTDGVDVTANGMFFCHNDIAAGDDNIAMSGSNLYIGYSSFGVGHGCSIGSITKSGVSHVTVDHLTMNGTTSGIRMKSARDRGGLVTDLVYSNVTMTNVPTPISITSYYPSLPADPKADDAVAVTSTTPFWQNITIKNLTATGATAAGQLWGLPEARIANVTLDNVRISASTGMKIFHATGIAFTNGSTITPKSGPPVTIYDATVSGIATTGL